MSHIQFRAGKEVFVVSWNAQGFLSRIDWYDAAEAGDVAAWSESPQIEIPSAVSGVIDQLKRYFQSGEPIDTIPWSEIDMSEWTDFQKSIYQAITKIPHGETRTYSWVASRVGNIGATRAVGQALKRNPLPILIPCHRVVAGASLGGFRGQSDEAHPDLLFKKRLINLELEYRNPVFSFLAPAWACSQGLAGACA